MTTEARETYLNSIPAKEQSIRKHIIVLNSMIQREKECLSKLAGNLSYWQRINAEWIEEHEYADSLVIKTMLNIKMLMQQSKRQIAQHKLIKAALKKQLPIPHKACNCWRNRMVMYNYVHSYDFVYCPYCGQKLK